MVNQSSKWKTIWPFLYFQIVRHSNNSFEGRICTQDGELIQKKVKVLETFVSSLFKPSNVEGRIRNTWRQFEIFIYDFIHTLMFSGTRTQVSRPEPSLKKEAAKAWNLATLKSVNGFFINHLPSMSSYKCHNLFILGHTPNVFSGFKYGMTN